MYLASAHVKAAFGAAQPKYVGGVLRECGVHGWLIAAILNGMKSLNGRATFENIKCTNEFHKCIRCGLIAHLFLCRTALLLLDPHR